MKKQTGFETLINNETVKWKCFKNPRLCLKDSYPRYSTVNINNLS